MDEKVQGEGMGKQKQNGWEGRRRMNGKAEGEWMSTEQVEGEWMGRQKQNGWEGRRRIDVKVDGG